MTELPPNSYASKAKEEQTKGQLSDETLEMSEKPKEGLGKRLFKQFFAMGAKEMWSHLREDVVVPSAKNIASDLIVGAKDLMLFGSSTPTSTGRSTQTDYAGISSKKGPSEKERARFDFRNVVVNTREQAVNTIISMQEWASKYDGVVPVSYFYSQTGIQDTFVDHSYGWRYKDLSEPPEHYIRQTAKGWTFVLPAVVKFSDQ